MAARRILVVEDEPDMLALYRDYLSREGYEVLTALNGEEALAVAKAERPDLVVLDVMLPILDGYHVAYELSRQQVPPRILMATCRSKAREEGVALMTGAAAVLEKPIDLPELGRKVAELLGPDRQPAP